MSFSNRDDGVSRRKVLECMTWVGTGVLWTVSGGVPHSLGIMGEAAAAEAKGLTFLQISDSHVGFHLPPNSNALGTLEEAIAKVNALTLPQKPAFMIHTGDISHLSLEAQFDDADKVISQARLDVHYVPGEHDFLDPDRKFYVDRYGRGTKGAGWYSFDANGVHFIGLVNVFNLKGGGMGDLGAEQLEWLEDDLKGRSASTPIVVFAHIPLWTIYPEWGWGTDDSAQALSYLKRFGSVTVLNGHIHQIMQKVEGNVTFHTARSTAFPQPAPGTAPPQGRSRTSRSTSWAPCLASLTSRSNRTSSASPLSTRHFKSEGVPNVRLKVHLRHNAQRARCGRARRRNRDHAGRGRAARLGAKCAAGERRRHIHRQLHLHAANADSEARHHGHLDEPGRHPARDRRGRQWLRQIEGAGYRRQLSFTFTTPGTYKYFCYVHPHMTGTIVVEPDNG